MNSRTFGLGMILGLISVACVIAAVGACVQLYYVERRMLEPLLALAFDIGAAVGFGCGSIAVFRRLNKSSQMKDAGWRWGVRKYLGLLQWLLRWTVCLLIVGLVIWPHWDLGSGSGSGYWGVGRHFVIAGWTVEPEDWLDAHDGGLNQSQLQALGLRPNWVVSNSTVFIVSTRQSLEIAFVFVVWAVAEAIIGTGKMNALKRLKRANRCLSCGYSLNMLPPNKPCPECGWLRGDVSVDSQ